MSRDETYLYAARDVLRRVERVQPVCLHELEGANAGYEIEACRAMRLVWEAFHAQRWRGQSVRRDQYGCVGRARANASDDAAEEPQLARRAEAKDTADIPKIPTDAEREDIVIVASERAKMIAPLCPNVPRYAL
jgi:hypothetical protein